MTASLRNAGSRRNAPQRPGPKRAVLCSPLGAAYVNQFRGDPAPHAKLRATQMSPLYRITAVLNSTYDFSRIHTLWVIVLY